ncbi:PREDICTED: uncharacterized protein LOC107333286, partial [Acropora digitifera]|uniref:uncharacterized protein LOC107333286 n=1 Tax=Acropora digitifera TaxID=70779 RepID=UPI00077B0CA3
EQTYGFFPKTMNKGYTVAVEGKCNGTTGKLRIEWYLLVAECAGWFESFKDYEEQTVIESVMRRPDYKNHSLHWSGEVNCTRKLYLPDATDQKEKLILDEDDDNNKGPGGKHSNAKQKSTKTDNSTPKAEPHRKKRSDNAGGNTGNKQDKTKSAKPKGETVRQM